MASWGLLLVYFTTYDDQTPPPALLRTAQRVLWAAMSWWAILAACGWAQRAFPVESPRLRAASAAVFCAYVLHQSVIVLLTQALKPLALPRGLEALLLIGLTVAVCAAACWLLRQVPGLALLVGIQRQRQQAPVAQPLRRTTGAGG